MRAIERDRIERIRAMQANLMFRLTAGCSDRNM